MPNWFCPCQGPLEYVLTVYVVYTRPIARLPNPMATSKIANVGVLVTCRYLYEDYESAFS